MGVDILVKATQIPNTNITVVGGHFVQQVCVCIHTYCVIGDVYL